MMAFILDNPETPATVEHEVPLGRIGSAEGTSPASRSFSPHAQAPT